MILHAGLVAVRQNGRWRGALIEGPSGVGKSDIALRAVAAGFRLVADDRTLVWTSGGRLFGRAPDPLWGLLEARGVGVTPEPAIPLAEVALVATCMREADGPERLPESVSVAILDINLAHIDINPWQSSALAKLRRAIDHLGAAAQQAYQPTPLGGRGRAEIGDTV